jgi:hypothetical protein
VATIIEIIQEFCARVNNPIPSTIVGVSSPTEQQYLSLFKFVGDNLRNRPYQWPQLKRGYTFNTTTDVTKYQLPGDFYRLLDSSQWDETNQWPLRGPMSDYAHTLRQFAAVSLQTRKAFRIIGPMNYLVTISPYAQHSRGWFEIEPAGENNTDELFLGYLSCNWIQPRNWVSGQLYSAGDIRSGVGYVYRTAAGGSAGATRPTWSTGTQSDGTVSWTVYNEAYPISTTNTNLNDLDLCLFDDDLMIEGLRWAYMRAKKQDYQQERADWEQMVKSAYARFSGPCRISMDDQSSELLEWPNVPAGSWSV